MNNPVVIQDNSCYCHVPDHSACHITGLNRFGCCGKKSSTLLANVADFKFDALKRILSKIPVAELKFGKTAGFQTLIINLTLSSQWCRDPDTT